MQNCPQFVVAVHAVLRADAVVVPVNPMNKADEFGHYITDPGTRVVLTTADLVATVAEANARLPTEQQLALAHGVSRTVVREAMHQLKSRQLVVSRQGSGVFVAAKPLHQPLAFDPAVLARIAPAKADKAPEEDPGLTERERQVLELMVDGLGKKEIAAAKPTSSTTGSSSGL